MQCATYHANKSSEIKYARGNLLNGNSQIFIYANAAALILSNSNYRSEKSVFEIWCTTAEPLNKVHFAWVFMGQSFSRESRCTKWRTKKNIWWVTSEGNVSKNNAMRISWSVNRFCSFRDKQKTDSYFFKHPPRGAFILLAFVWLSSQYWCMFQFSLQYMLKRHFIYSVYGFISFFASDWYSKLYHLMIKIERRC